MPQIIEPWRKRPELRLRRPHSTRSLELQQRRSARQCPAEWPARGAFAAGRSSDDWGGLGPPWGLQATIFLGDFEDDPEMQKSIHVWRGFLNRFCTSLKQKLGVWKSVIPLWVIYFPDCFGHWLYHSRLYNFETQQTAFSISPVEHFCKTVDYKVYT